MAPVKQKKQPVKKQQTNAKPTAKKVVTKKTAPKKNKNIPKLEEGVDGVIEYEDLGKIDQWDWTETKGTESFIADEAGGFLCLEEISDVEIEYEGDDTTGKVAKFKVKSMKGSERIPTVCLQIIRIFFYREERSQIVRVVRRQNLLFLYKPRMSFMISILLMRN